VPRARAERRDPPEGPLSRLTARRVGASGDDNAAGVVEQVRLSFLACDSVKAVPKGAMPTYSPPDAMLTAMASIGPSMRTGVAPAVKTESSASVSACAELTLPPVAQWWTARREARRRPSRAGHRSDPIWHAAR